MDRLLSEREVRVELTEGAKDLLVELGYKPAFGARPLRRAILRYVQDPLAEALIAGDHGKGEVVRVDVEGERGKVAKE